ncbi:MAG: hypothetical protein ACK5AY_01700, partial [Bacteroidota bacterium]
MKKYTFNDWWHGRVYLETCELSYSKGDNFGKKAALSDFNKKDQTRILIKQKRLFLQSCNKLLKSYIKEFKFRFKNSEAKEKFVENELIDLDHFFNTRTKTGLRFINRDFIIEPKELFKIRRYLNVQIIRGKKDYSFIHSPNYKFQQKGKISLQIYTYTNWQYWTWVREFHSKHIKIISAGSKKSNFISPKSTPMIVIALIQIYQGIVINRRNAVNIAAQYGYISKCSGAALYNKFCEFSKITNRTGSHGSRKSDSAKLKNMELTIKNLSG